MWVPLLSLLMYLLSQWQFALSFEVKSLQSGNHKTMTQVDRRPAILHPPSDVPVGDQAHLYQFMLAQEPAESEDSESNIEE